jgi:hypothetical protein
MNTSKQIDPKEQVDAPSPEVPQVNICNPKKVRVGVIVDTLGRTNFNALRYAILRLNVCQTFAEFEIIYGIPPSEPFVEMARRGGQVEACRIKELA